jgi:peptidoglycan-associated lipoprotein
MRRATSARDYLMGFGISADRFEVVSFGEDRPADSGSNEQAWSRNRRADFVVTAGGENLVMPGN